MVLYNKRYVNCSDDSYTSIVFVYCKKRPVIKYLGFWLPEDLWILSHVAWMLQVTRIVNVTNRKVNPNLNLDKNEKLLIDLF